MKKFILSSLLFLSTLNLYAMSGSTDIQDVNTVTHSCACASDLSQAFSDIQSTIFDDYLLPLKDSFEDPIKAIEAVFDGFEVMPMKKAARYGDIFLTVTGDIDIITEKHFMEMKDGAICANAGHFDCEVSRKDLERISDSHYEARKNIEAYILLNGNTIYLMAEGRLVNLAAGDGHPVEIMDLSFAMQALAVSYLCEHEKELRPQLYLLPRELDEKVAEIKLKSMGYEIDTLSDKQKEYLGLD